MVNNGKIKLNRWTSQNEDMHIKVQKSRITMRRGNRIMATQIAPTPILYGNEAQKVIEEIKVMPSEKSKDNAKKLMEFFSKFTF